MWIKDYNKLMWHVLLIEYTFIIYILLTVI